MFSAPRAPGADRFFSGSTGALGSHSKELECSLAFSGSASLPPCFLSRSRLSGLLFPSDDVLLRPLHRSPLPNGPGAWKPGDKRTRTLRRLGRLSSTRRASLPGAALYFLVLRKTAAFRKLVPATQGLGIEKPEARSDRATEGPADAFSRPSVLRGPD